MRRRKKLLTIITSLVLILLIAGGGYWLYHNKKTVSNNPTQEDRKTEGVKNWISYQDSEKKFSVLLPTAPQFRTVGEENSKDKFDEYFSIKPTGGQYSIRIYPKNKGANDEKLLNDIVKSIQNESGGNAKLIYSNIAEDVNKVAFLDYKILTETQELKGRMFASKNSVFVLISRLSLQQASDKKLIESNEFNDFINSFSLI